MKIKTIEIEAFRGIPELKRDIGGKSLLIHGENGTGKSSIVDAMEFIFTGKISHPSPFKLKEDALHVSSSKPLRINLEMDPGQILVERKLNSAFKCPNSLKELFKNAENSKFILRRSEILRFIDSTPSKRYEFIGSSMGIKELDKIEAAFREAEKSINTELNFKIIELNDKKKSIESLLEYEIEKEDDILPYINKLLEKENYDTLESLDDLEDYAYKLNETVKTVDISKLTALETILKTQNSIIQLNDTIPGKLEKIDAIKNDIINSHQLNELSIINLLEESKEIINSESEKCPLCEQKISGQDLINRIDVRLNLLKKLKKQKNQLDTLIQKLKEDLNSTKRNYEDIISNIETFDKLTDEKKEIHNEVTQINAFLELITVNSVLQSEINSDSYSKLKNSQETQINGLKEKIEELKKDLSPNEEDEKKSEILKLILELNREIKNYKSICDDISNLKKNLLIAQNMHEKFSIVKKQKIQEIYDSIEEEIQYLYDILHPKDLHEDIKLNIDMAKRGSTDIRMTIFGKTNKDPRALSSEGHLDSLGLCIFLALFKKFNNDFPILILDDVVSTIDSRHRENVCNLLFDEFGDKQFIITTHDKIWFEQIQAAQRAYQIGSKFENLEIIGWNIKEGPSIKPYKPRWDQIKEKIKNGDKNCAGNDGRRYLEWLLENICVNCKTSVMINPSGRFMVNDLLDPAKVRLTKLIQDQEFKDKISQAFEKLEQTRIVGNLTSHENLMAGNISIDEVERFCNSVNEIHELMLCEKCKTPLRYYQELKILRCSNQKCSNPTEIKAK